MAIQINGTTVLNDSRNLQNITAISETRINLGSGTAIDLSTGSYFTKTLTGSTNFSVSNVPTAGSTISFILELTNAGAWTVGWWLGITWSSGVTPTLTASGTDILGFYTHDGGTTWRGLLLARDTR